jgi:hypothetical protein
LFVQDVPPPQEPCVSLVVQGRLLEQDPDFYPEPEVPPNVIVMRWRWRIALRVDRVVLGEFDLDRLEADSIQHTDIQEDYGRTFLLGRVNGTYRVLGISPRALSRPRDLAREAAESDVGLCGAG